MFFSYGKGSFSFANLVSGITKRFSTDFELQEVRCPHKPHYTRMQTKCSQRSFREKKCRNLDFCFHRFPLLSVTLQLQQFKEDNLHVGFGSATLALEQAIEKTIANIKWVTENKEHVLRWFAEEIA